MQADVSQQDSEKMRLRREMEDIRNKSGSSLAMQQGQWSDMIAGRRYDCSRSCLVMY